MKFIDYLLLFAIFTALFFAVKYLIKHRGSSCCSDCEKCKKCCSTPKDEQDKPKEKQ